MFPDEYAKYQKQYAKYLQAACSGHADSRFTSKSHIYRYLHYTIGETGDMLHFLQMFLGSIGAHVDMYHHFRDMGALGMTESQEKWYRERIKEFMGCP